MTIKKRKKVTRQRGSRTHGWGLVHRNSGQRGGAGNASRGKKAHAKKPSNWKDKENPTYFGKFGFKQKGPVQEDITITIKDLEDRTPRLITEKKATVKEAGYTIDLEKLGYTKLLSTGKATKKYTLTIARATPNAIKKITAAGGTVTTKETTP